MGIESAPTQLKRTLGLRTVVSTSAGLTFASSTFLVVVYIGHVLHGHGAWIPIALAGLLCLLAAAAFSELNGIYPSAAGIRLWIHRAYGEKAALVTALTYMSVVALVVGTEAYVLSYVLNEAFKSVPPPVWIGIMLTLATVANLTGLRVAGAMQDVITYSVVISILTMSAIVLTHTHVSAGTMLVPTAGIGDILSMIGFAVFLFVGFEWVTPLAEEVKKPKSIPYGMFIALGLLVLSYSVIATAMFAGPHETLFGTAASRQPIPHIIFALTNLGPAGKIAMIITSLCMSLTTFNAGLISVSRFLYASARENVLPKGLERITVRPSHTTPSAAIWTVFVLALAVSLFVYFTKQYVVLVNVAAATESIIYAFAAACVFMLRRKEASLPRSYKMWGGLWLPVLTGVVFLLLGVAVFFTDTTFNSWGAGVILLTAAVGWWIYLHFVALPRKEKIRAEQAAKRQSRRPTKPTDDGPQEATA